LKHRACLVCGTYRGKQVLEVAKKTEKKHQKKAEKKAVAETK
jgi:hypothetical protein